MFREGEDGGNGPGVKSPPGAAEETVTPPLKVTGADFTVRLWAPVFPSHVPQPLSKQLWVFQWKAVQKHPSKHTDYTQIQAVKSSSLLPFQPYTHHIQLIYTPYTRQLHTIGR